MQQAADGESWGVKILGWALTIIGLPVLWYVTTQTGWFDWLWMAFSLGMVVMVLSGAVIAIALAGHALVEWLKG